MHAYRGAPYDTIESERSRGSQGSISIAKLAWKADLGNRTVYRIVHDPYAEITSITLGRLAEALEVSVKELIEDALASGG